MKNILISGAPSVGKSTVIAQLENKIPQKDCLVTRDQARWYMEKNNLKADTMSKAQKNDMQQFVIATYVGAIIHAKKTNIMGVLDGSLIEAKNYSDGVVKDELLHMVKTHLQHYKEHSVAYILPPTIPLVKDGLRHASNDFRIEMHEKIVQTIIAHKIPYHFIVSEGPRNRANEILSYHEQYMPTSSRAHV